MYWKQNDTQTATESRVGWIRTVLHDISEHRLDGCAATEGWSFRIRIRRKEKHTHTHTKNTSENSPFTKHTHRHVRRCTARVTGALGRNKGPEN